MAAGLLLAAGAGRRMGRPKALVEIDGEPLVRRSLRVLADGGCAPLLVVIGAAATEVLATLPPDVLPVVAPDWAEGMGASLRAGLAAAAGLTDVPDAVCLHLVDLPGVTAGAVARLVAADSGPDVLLRAAYAGRQGHPVLIGRAHWDEVRDSAVGDVGARAYLAGHPALRLVECGDLGRPDDVDTPGQLARHRDSAAVLPPGSPPRS